MDNTLETKKKLGIKGWKILAIVGFASLGVTIITATSVAIAKSNEYVKFGPYRIKNSDILSAELALDDSGEYIHIVLLTGKSIDVHSRSPYFQECYDSLHKFGWF
ncbi:MAG: hypothetical protein LBS76_03745 [Mycoplasmataceae bacterium]|jgi:hypothetical protein|nr:hypothetical protein [Mycoplasmataceae bacterium]